jgi:uncharacterized membrane protein
MFGGKVISIAIYPAFYTDCLIRPDQLICYVFTAISGILFPLFCSVMFSPYRDRNVCMMLSLRVMSLVYSVVELIGVSRCLMGRAVQSSDLAVLISETTIDPYIPLVLAGFLMILSLLLLAAADPVRLVMQFSGRKGDREASRYAAGYESY